VYSGIEPKVRRLRSRLGWNKKDSVAAFCRGVEADLKRNPCEVIYAPVASEELSRLKTDIPIVFATDATPPLLRDHYHSYPDHQSFEEAFQREREVLSKCARAVYSSQWAADSAVEHLGADPAKVRLIDFGANLDEIPSMDEATKHHRSHPCRLLFVGLNWQRKGGQIAVDTVQALRRRGIDASLTIIGSTPPKQENDPSCITVHPFLDKHRPKDLRIINQLLLESTFFLLPTRADCSPIVLCEANAFGLPVITTDVGGLPSIVREGVNGCMLPLDASGEEFADRIACALEDENYYKSLVMNAKSEYEKRLNWAAWGESMERVLREVVSVRGQTYSCTMS
jgi:glycosyltransferase involved in cell wall biosynthesis